MRGLGGAEGSLARRGGCAIFYPNKFQNELNLIRRFLCASNKHYIHILVLMPGGKEAHIRRRRTNRELLFFFALFLI
jgi:hypothetical protein